uniref:CHCH domain-containing protein n=1 Tax=Panagrellus redivivus TaxID=6233 RepID=A0A7E4UW01_PANRE
MVRPDKKKAAAKKAASSSSSSSSSAPAPAPTAPVHHAAAPAAPAAPKQPGLLAQAAATGAGVAIGSSVGHAVGNMMTGSGSKPSTAAAASPEDTKKCEFELKQLLDCTNRQTQVTDCQSYFDALKACRSAK